MENNCDFLTDLGYTKEDIAGYVESRAEKIVSRVAANRDNVLENLRYLQDDFFDADVLLNMAFCYEAFTMNTDSFRHAVDLLKNDFPYEYADIMEQQFSGYDGIADRYAAKAKKPVTLYLPFLEVVPLGEDAVREAVESLKYPSTRVYGFVVILNEELGLGISAEDVPEDCLLDLEALKWEVLASAKELVKQGFPKNIIADMLQYCPRILMEPTHILQRVLQNHFGENYIVAMQVKAMEEDWVEKLQEME